MLKLERELEMWRGTSFCLSYSRLGSIWSWGLVVWRQDLGCRKTHFFEFNVGGKEKVRVFGWRNGRAVVRALFRSVLSTGDIVHAVGVIGFPK
jgi:hypothetical protein